MARGKSFSYSSAAASFSTTEALPSFSNKCSHSGDLKKTTSMVDLKSSNKGVRRKWLKRLRSKGDFDFGCAGEIGFSDEASETNELLDEAWDIRKLSEPGQQTLYEVASTPHTAPPAALEYVPFPIMSPVISTPPSRPVTMPTLPLLPNRLVPTDPVEYDQYLKEKARMTELRLAEEACLAYCTGSVPTLVPTCTSSQEHYFNHDSNISASSLEKRSRTNSSTSSSRSPSSQSSFSRPRTNESLPSSFDSQAPSTTKDGTPSPGRTIFPVPVDPDATRPYKFI